MSLIYNSVALKSKTCGMPLDMRYEKVYHFCVRLVRVPVLPRAMRRSGGIGFLKVSLYDRYEGKQTKRY
jgi:hypothetical protein